MSWEKIDENRWRWSEPECGVDRHLLVRVGDELRELHGDVVHVYGVVDGERWSLVTPLDPGVEWMTTCTDTSWVFGARQTEGDLFDWLEQGGYLP